MRLPLVFFLLLLPFSAWLQPAAKRVRPLQEAQMSTGKAAAADEENTETIPLKGGYALYYFTDDTASHLLLRKQKVITEISYSERGAQRGRIGFLACDFRNSFIVAWREGSGGSNPTYFSWIRKSDGKVLLPDRGNTFIDADTAAGIFVYSDDVPVAPYRFYVVDVNTGKEKSFPFPRALWEGPHKPQRLELRRVTKNRITFSYITGSGEQRQSSYRR
jgi:hypothetical protein